MLLVCFINGTGEDEYGVECRDELHLEYDTFPIVGDFIQHDGVGYVVADRYIVSHSVGGSMRADRVQYTLELDREEEELEEFYIPKVTDIQMQYDPRKLDVLYVSCRVDGTPFTTTLNKLDVHRAGVKSGKITTPREEHVLLIDLILDKWNKRDDK